MSEDKRTEITLRREGSKLSLVLKKSGEEIVEQWVGDKDWWPNAFMDRTVLEYLRDNPEAIPKERKYSTQKTNGRGTERGLDSLSIGYLVQRGYDIEER